MAAKKAAQDQALLAAIAARQERKMAATVPGPSGDVKSSSNGLQGTPGAVLPSANMADIVERATDSATYG